MEPDLKELAEATARHLWDRDPSSYLEEGYDDVWDLVREVRQALRALIEVVQARPESAASLSRLMPAGGDRGEVLGTRP